jgi:hypothetical protein
VIFNLSTPRDQEMDSSISSSLFLFGLKIEDSTGTFSSDLQSLPQIGRIEDLRNKFLWNLQSSIQMQAGD